MCLESGHYRSGWVENRKKRILVNEDVKDINCSTDSTVGMKDVYIS